MDGILDGPMKEKAFMKTAQRLLSKLDGRWVALASDRVGQHTVKKLFHALSVEDKGKLNSELAQGTNRLRGSSMGRSVMDVCALEVFSRSEKEWKEAIRKREQKDTWLQDVLEAETEEPKKKRKRNRKRKSRSGEVGVEQKPRLNAVDAIMNAISVSGKK